MISHVSRYLDPALVEHLNHMQLSARSVVQGAAIGQHKSPLKGASVDFRQHRFYVPGDEPRRLDWRVLARTDRPYVKEYDEETNLRCMLVIDASGSMAYDGGGGSKYDYAARLVAALAYLMLRQNESVGLAACRAGLEHWLPAHSGPVQLSRIIEKLERVVPRGESGIAQAMHETAERLERRALVLVISDFFVGADVVRSGLAHLRHKRHEVVALQVVDRDEEQFPFRHWARFRGLEGEGSRLCEPALMRKAYLEAFGRHRRSLQEACISLNIAWQPFVTDRAVLEVLKAFVSRRSQG